MPDLHTLRAGALLAASALLSACGPPKIDNPRERLTEILEGVPLRLATEGESAGDRFSFQIEFKSLGFFIDVQRDGDRAAIAFRDPETGLPLGFATRDLAVVPSLRYPGRLEAVHGNSAEIRAREGENMTFMLFGLGAGDRGGVDIDFNLVPERIAKVLDSNLPVTGRREGDLLVFALYPKRGKRLLLRIDPAAPFPIRDLILENHGDDDSVRVLDIRVDEAPPRPLTKFQLEDLDEAGLHYSLLHRSHLFPPNESYRDLMKSASQQSEFMAKAQKWASPFLETLSTPPVENSRVATARTFLSLFPLDGIDGDASADIAGIADFTPDLPWPGEFLAFDFPVEDDDKVVFPPDADRVTIPIEFGGYLPFVKTMIDGRESGYFLIDTGAQVTLLRKATADRMNLGWNRKLGETIVETGGEQESSRRGLASLEIGAITFHPGEVVAADLSQLDLHIAEKIEGVIGRDILGLAPFTIDYSAKTLTFHRPAAFKPPPDALAVTTPWIGNPPAMPATVIRIKGAGKDEEVLCGIDTGMETALALQEDFIDWSAHALESWPRWRSQVVGPSLLRETTKMRPPAGAIEIFDRAAALSSVSTGKVEESHAGTVGALALKDFRVTFDARSEALYLEETSPPAPVADRIAAGWDPGSRDLRGYTPLALACIQNNLPLLREFLDAGVRPSGSHELAEAINAGNAEFARLLIEAGADVNGDEGLALRAAAGSGQPAIARMLLEAGAGVTSEKSSAFHLSIDHGESEILRLLLEAGADRIITDGDRSIPALCLAARRDHPEIARALLEAGADIDALAENGHTPLWTAVLNEHSEFARLLLEHSPDLTVTDESGNTLLHMAASFGNTEIVELLLDAGLDPTTKNGTGLTPLHLTCRDSGSSEVAALLIERGADPAETDPILGTSLHFAAYHGHADLAALLIERGADVNRAGNSDFTPLHLAALSGQPKIVSLLLDAGASLDAEDADGDTPLAVAAYACGIVMIARAGEPELQKQVAQQVAAGFAEGVEPDHAGTVATLLERGADPSLLTDDGMDSLRYLSLDWHQFANIRTLLERGLDPASSPLPLQAAAMTGNTEIAELLLEHGAAALAENNGLDPPFLLAVKNGHLQTAKLLLKHGADPRAVDPETGLSALHRAVRHEHDAFFNLLAEAGADPNAKDIDDDTPLHLAAREDRIDSARALLALGADPTLKNAILETPLFIAKFNTTKDEKLITLLEKAIENRNVNR